jgi:putative heme iron utilization protein
MTRLMSTSEEGKKTEAGHQPPPGHKGPAMPEMSPEDMEIVNNFREHQKGAARISMAEEVRTLIDKSLAYGVLSTNSNSLEGYPTGSVVGFEVDDEGKPFFVFSTMSAHTTDILKDGKSSLTVMASDFKGAAEGRVVIVGDVVKVFDDAEKAKLREKYLSRHKEAFWIDFGDFSYFRMKSMNTIRYIGGFAMAGSVTPEEYTSAKPDPVAGFASHVMGHMNDDHEDSTIAMVKHYCGIPVTEAKIIGMDRLGMTVNTKIDMAASGGGYTKVCKCILSWIHRHTNAYMHTHTCIHMHNIFSQ